MAEWWQTGVMYNLYVRSFLDASGDGIGDLTGVIDKLDYLSETLGVDVLWLTGILGSPWKEFGFDVSDPWNVHPAFGTLQTFDELVRQAHERGLKIVIDYVVNHTSNQHPWFLESSGTRDNPKRDWYIWNDPKRDGTPPNNWLSLFGGSCWEWDEITWQYYLHTFLKEQPDLNWRSPGLRAAMYAVARFWLDRGVDGFRIDAAHHIMKDPELRNNPPGATPRDLEGRHLAHEYQKTTHSQEHPDLHEVYRELRAVLDEYGREPPRAMFGEIHPGGGWPAWSEYFGKRKREFHFPLNNGFINVAWQAQAVREVIDQVEAALPAHGWPNAHTGNFDEKRVATRYGSAAARVAAMLLLTLRGTPILYYGEEIGMSNAAIAPELEQDPFGKRVGVSRDPNRTPMHWNPGPHAGFSAHTTPRLWLPLASNYRSVNVETELDDPGSILNLYRALIRLRKSAPALQLGSYRALDGGPEDVYAYLRELNGERWLAALNFSKDDQVLALEGLGTGKIALSTYLDKAGEPAAGSMALRPDEGLLVLLESTG